MTDRVEHAVVFGSAVEGFVKSLRSPLAPHVLQEFARLGIDLEQPAPAYALENWETAMRFTANDLYGSLPDDERYRQLGRDFIKGYIQTAFGKAALAFTRIIGPRRTLQRMSNNFRSAANYIGCEASDLRERHVELRTWMLPQFLPYWRNRPTFFVHYRHGVLEEMMAQQSVEARVETLSYQPEDQTARYSVTW
ncbi:MAG: DUF2378 family protein [Myxococcaceae bacterium]|nr:DUF2378 family protein [Myxococcaceae bacterium]